MTHAGYFEGIGGFSLAAEWAGIDTIYTCENNEFRHAWLKQILPKAIHEKDITTANGHYADIFTAGFPCQDISVANARGKGLEGARSGLFWDFFNIVGNLRPRYIILENSPNLIHKGLDDIVKALSKIGYDCEWEIISKKAFGFPDLRKRIFIVAYSDQVRRNHADKVFNQQHLEMCFKKVINQKQIQIETERIFDEPSLREAHTIAVKNDSGLSDRLAQDEIEAYGDAVCPYVAMFVLEMIKKFDEKR